MTAAQWIFFSEDAIPEESLLRDASPATLLGGKGQSLRQLLAAGISIPRGFTITTAACREALGNAGEWPAGLDEELANAVSRLAKETGRSIDDGPNALRLAVRSGAAISMPGMLDTILDCDATMAEMRTAVTAVFNSWHNERAIAWRNQHGIDDSVGTAVTVQELIEPDTSGVLFTSSPEEIFQRGSAGNLEMLVEAVAGRGDALVSGQVTPSRFAIDRASLAVRQLDSGSVEARLTDPQLRELCKIGLRLEAEFGEPLDIEWGLTGGDFIFFQARPIAVGAPVPRSDPGISTSQLRACRKAEVSRVADLLTTCRALVRHNLGESLPAPSPMTWSIVRRMMSGSGGLGRLYRTLGYSPGQDVCDEGFLELVAGRIYADPDRMVELFAAEWPMCHDLATLREHPDQLDEAPRHFDPDQTHPLLLLLLPHLAWVVLRSSRRIPTLMVDAERRFQNEALPRWQRWVDQQRSQNLTAFSHEELLAILGDRIRRTVGEFAAESLLPGTLGAIALATLIQQLRRFCGEESATRFRELLLSSTQSPLQQRQSELFTRLASGEDVQSDFLTEFGHRGQNEMELSAPRWREQHPQAGPHHNQPNLESEPTHQAGNEDLAEQLRSALSEAGVPRQADALVGQLEFARRLLPLRETGRHELMRGFELIREVLEEIGRRLDVQSEVYFLTAEELFELPLSETCDELIARRRANHQAARQLWVPEFLDRESVEEIALASDRQVAGGISFEADTLAPGRCSGTVVRIDSAAGNRNLPPQSILVAEAIDPGLTPVLLQSAGIIVARGGMLSHGAVIARQLGLPAVRCADAVEALRDGQRVSIDTATSSIRVVSDD